MKVYSAVKNTWKASYIRLYVKFKCKESMIICLIIRKNACERNGICSALCYMLQYSISMLKGLKGFLKECTADMKSVWSPLSVPTRSSPVDNQVPCQYYKNLFLLK